MAGRKKRATTDGQEPTPVTHFRHDATRKNIPAAGLAAQAKVRETPRSAYAYDPHLPPVLRFDPSGAADALPELIQAATKRPLTDEEARLVAGALRHREPWLEWAGKQEQKGFVTDPVALHIHERVSAQAILKVAKREDVQRDLFADPQQPYREAVQFYQHDVDWANRLILGDSLQVMASLAKREDLAGKVQMIYLDPPYGIKFASNFQSEIGKREVKDKDSDLTREPEMVKAYRDTWTLGVHSYLGYLRDRLLAARDMLADSGSLFVQISEVNHHRVRALLDEVFGSTNYVTTIAYKTAVGMASGRLDPVFDCVVWYAKNAAKMKYRQLYQPLTVGGEGASRYKQAASKITGEERLLSEEEREDPSRITDEWRPFRDQGLTSRSGSATTIVPFEFQDEVYLPPTGGWRTNLAGLQRVMKAERLMRTGATVSYKKYFDDSSALALTNFWSDTGGGITSRTDPKVYVVQTSNRVIERCMLMSTEPGDLILDPTCGSGTTAVVAEQWGRRWITIDTSRVALGIARQRLLTARFDQYRLRDRMNGNSNADCDPSRGFRVRTFPRVTLGSISRNVSLDQILSRHQLAMVPLLESLNSTLVKVGPELRRQLKSKLSSKERQFGKRAITEADRRRWVLPATNWKEWEVPFDSDEDWPVGLRVALAEFRAAWRAKMDEVDAAIAANAETEELVDQPDIVPDVVRVTGPFTVEAVMPAEDSLEDSPIEGIDGEDLETFGASSAAADTINGEAFVDRMRRLLLADGVRFHDNKVARISRLDPIEEEYLHAEGEWISGDGGERKVAVSFGPPHGAVTAVQVEQALHTASRRGFDDVVFAGFSFDGAAQGVIQDDPNPRVRAHLAHIRPDVQMTGLLKETPNSQLFTVFGTPRTSLERYDDGTLSVTMEGVDIYNPVENTIVPTRADKVAAWFLDTDYDGRTFCITQAFFPDKSAWANLARSLKGYLDEDRFAALSGTRSLPFVIGKHKRCAVKVIDPRGNEVMRIHRL